MTDLVPPGDIERIVGVPRGRNTHYASAVSAEQRVYILHSRECLDSGIDLRECAWSQALDEGIDVDDWDGYEDRPVVVVLRVGRLVPLRSGGVS